MKLIAALAAAALAFVAVPAFAKTNQHGAKEESTGSSTLSKAKNAVKKLTKRAGNVVKKD